MGEATDYLIVIFGSITRPSMFTILLSNISVLSRDTKSSPLYFLVANCDEYRSGYSLHLQSLEWG